MRKFKFRGWHPDFQLMFYFELKDVLAHFEDAQFIKEQGEWQFCNRFYLRDLRIMQYLGTDCKDCEGTELCEDDLVQYKETIFRIIFNYGQFCIQSINSEIVDAITSWNDYIKIGNAHQNTELLNSN